jgi:hypothetical protein
MSIVGPLYDATPYILRSLGPRQLCPGASQYQEETLEPGPRGIAVLTTGHNRTWSQTPTRTRHQHLEILYIDGVG